MYIHIWVSICILICTAFNIIEMNATPFDEAPNTLPS